MKKLYGRIVPWLEALVLATGGPGMLVVGFVDSATTLPPVLIDILLIEVSMHRPRLMPYYVLMTVIGSVLGGLLLYILARTGEEKFVKKRTDGRAAKIRQWVARNGFLAVLLGALMPPPMPFKLVILAAGASEMPARPFISSLTLARVIRFSIEGILAVKYGAQALPFLEAHKFASTFWTIVIGFGFYFGVKYAMRPPKEESSPQNSRD